MPVDNRTQGEDDLLTPANVGTPSPGPEAVEQLDLPPTISEPQPVTDEAAEQSDVRAGDEDPFAALLNEPLPEFDPKLRLPFEGLAYLGKLTRKFEFIGHDFVIRTLSVDETLEIGLLTQDYVGTMSEMKAYQSALVAACIVTVDNKSLPMPITDHSDDTTLRNRFDYVRDHWFMPVLDKVYQEYLYLEVQVAQVVQALGGSIRLGESYHDFEIDPYVLGVIRLAQRRGRLTGELSMVQEYLLRILMLIEDVEADRKRFDERYTALRSALVGVAAEHLDGERIRKLWPEFFPQEEVEVVTAAELEDTEGEWRFESEMTEEEIQEVLRNMGRSAHLTLAETNGDDEENPWI